jgi:hypothetical protein
MTPQTPRSVCRARHRRPSINCLLSCQELQFLLFTVMICVMDGQSCRLYPCIGLRIHCLHDSKFDARCYGRKSVILHQDHCMVGFSLRCVR